MDPGEYKKSIFSDQINGDGSWWDVSLQWLDKTKQILTNSGFDCTYFFDDGVARFEKNKTSVLVNFASVLPHDSTWQITDSVPLDNNKNVLLTSPYSLGYYYCDYKYTNCMPTKEYNCFIKRSCPVRQSWFYLLIRKNILNNGNVSFWSENPIYENSSLELFELFYKGSEIFEPEHNYILNNLSIPYSNFDVTIEEATLDSKVSVVIETSFNDLGWILLTEKTFRALQLPRPLLLFSNPNSIAYLRQLGFNVYDDVVDHSYDSCPDWLERQSKILQQLDNSLKYNNATLKEFSRRAEHNKNVLLELRNSSDGYMQNIWNQIKQL